MNRRLRGQMLALRALAPIVLAAARSQLGRPLPVGVLDVVLSSKHFHQELAESLIAKSKPRRLFDGRSACSLRTKSSSVAGRHWCLASATLRNISAEIVDIVPKSVFALTSGIFSHRTSGWILMSSSHLGFAPRPSRGQPPEQPSIFELQKGARLQIGVSRRCQALIMRPS